MKQAPLNEWKRTILSPGLGTVEFSSHPVLVDSPFSKGHWDMVIVLVEHINNLTILLKSRVRPRRDSRQPPPLPAKNIQCSICLNSAPSDSRYAANRYGYSTFCEYINVFS